MIDFISHAGFNRGVKRTKNFAIIILKQNMGKHFFVYWWYIYSLKQEWALWVVHCHNLIN